MKLFKLNSESINPRIFAAVWLILTCLEGLCFSTLLIFHRFSKPGISGLPLTIGWIVVIVTPLLVSILLGVLGICLLSEKSKAAISWMKATSFFKDKHGWKVFGFILACVLLITFSLVAKSKFGSVNPILSSVVEPMTGWFYLVLFHSSILITFAIGHPKKLISSAALIFGIFIALCLFIAISGIGITPDDRYWNVAGIPVLAAQLAGILAGVVLFEYLFAQYKKRKGLPSHNRMKILDILISLILWGGAVILWMNTPFGNSFFTKGPFPPNNDLIPYSDSALMDLGGQYMLIGEGLEYPYFTEKNLYVLFLGVLHAIIGQNYLSTTSLQIAVFAIFPVLLYFLGKKMDSRLMGLILALFAVIKERNGIFSTFKISVSNSRLYLSEFPTAVALVLFTLLLFLWMRNPENKKYLLIGAGGVLGFATMIRTTPLIILPVTILMFLLVLNLNIKRVVTSSLIFIGGFALAIGPWVAYTHIEYGADPYSLKIENVVRSRFLSLPPKKDPTGTNFRDPILINYQPNEKNRSSTANGDGLAKITLGHFFNNEIKSLFIFPFQIYPQDLSTVLDQPYWEEPVVWRGDLPLSVFLAFITNIGLISLGIAYGWKKWRYAGLIPLLVNLAYFSAAALGRTSGSRYLLPVDWTVYIYYVLGMAFIVSSVIGKQPHSQFSKDEYLDTAIQLKPQLVRKKFIITTIVVLSVGILIPLVNNLFPKLYGKIDTAELIQRLVVNPSVKQLGVNNQSLTDYIDKGGVVIYGRMLYPRYIYFEDAGQSGLAMTVLTPQISEVFIPLESLSQNELPAGSSVIVVGCPKENYLEGQLAVIDDADLLIAPSPIQMGSCELQDSTGLLFEGDNR